MVARELDTAAADEAPRPSPVRDPSRIARLVGLTGTLLMAIGGLGAGALPVPNPVFGLRLLGLPSRNTTIAIAVTYTGICLLVLAWLWVGKMLRARGAVPPAPTPAPRAHRRDVGRAAGPRPAALLPRRLQLPRPERHPRPRARPVRARTGRGARRRRPAHPQHPQHLARHPRALRPALPDHGPRDHGAV